MTPPKLPENVSEETAMALVYCGKLETEIMELEARLASMQESLILAKKQRDEFEWELKAAERDRDSWKQSFYIQQETVNQLTTKLEAKLNLAVEEIDCLRSVLSEDLNCGTDLTSFTQWVRANELSEERLAK